MKEQSVFLRAVVTVSLVAAVALVPAWASPAEMLCGLGVVADTYHAQSLPATTTTDPALRPLADQPHAHPNTRHPDARLASSLASAPATALSPDAVVAPKSGAGRGNQMVFADEAEELVSAHTGVPINRGGQTIPGSGPGGVRVPDLEVRGATGSVRLRGSVVEVKASRYSNFGDISARGRAQILDDVAYVRRLRAKASLVRDPSVRAVLENAHVEVFSDLAAPTRGRFYRLVQQGLIKWRPIPR